jgi:HD associated region
MCLLIDGPIDADKLDYIIRDSTNLGLTYGAVIDVERLLRCLTIVSKELGGETYVNLGIHEKGRVTAEAVAFARYALYGSVYWHHAYRGVKTMLRRVAWEYLELVDRKDEKSHDGIGNLVKRDLYPYLRAGGAPQALPLTLVGGGGQLHPGDRAVLEWVAERSSDQGRALADMLKDRRLFKRVLVLSKWGNSSLWAAVTRCFEHQNWRKRLEFQRRFQTELAQVVEGLGAIGEARTSLVFPDARNAFLAAVNRGTIVVLLDAVPSRPGASGGLELLEEDDRRRAKIDEVTTTHAEASAVWDALRESLQDTLGKVRVFCHPGHSRFISALDRTVLESAVERAARAVS